MKRGHAVDPWHPGTVTFDPGRGGGSHAPVLRSDLREPLRAQRDPLASSGGRPRVNREDRGQFKKQGWLGRFVSTYGWRAYALALLGAGTTMLGMLLPSGVLTYTATRWAHRNRTRRSVRAFKAGMAPIVIGLLLVTGWLLTGAHDQPARDAPLWLLTAATTLVVWRTRLHLLWLIGAGALLGALGWV